MPDNLVIDLPMAVSGILKLISEKPEGYKYQDNPLASGFAGCRNALWDEDGQRFVPGCLIGSMFMDMGFTGEDVGWDGRASLAVEDLLCSLGVDRTNAADRYMRVAQKEQDRGATWANAHMTALEMTLLGVSSSDFSDAEREWLGIRQ